MFLSPTICPHTDSASVATEYSLKFDESMTEDEIEERSFRSLLPSESHRRGVLEKKRVPHEESDDEPSQENPTAQDSSKVSLPPHLNNCNAGKVARLLKS